MSIADEIHAALRPVYGNLTVSHQLRLFRRDQGLTRNDDWIAFLETNSPVAGSKADMLLAYFKEFSEGPASVDYTGFIGGPGPDLLIGGPGPDIINGTPA